MPINTADLNRKVDGLVKSIDFNGLKGQLDTVSTKFKAFDVTEQGKNLGDVKGGFEGLTQNLDNVVEQIAGDLDANGFPTGGVSSATITKLDPSVQGSVEAFKTALASHSADISALVSSTHGTSESQTAAAAPDAKELIASAEGLLNDIIADGSPEAIAGVLKAKANVNPDEIEGLLGQVANPEVKDTIASACRDLLDFKLPADLGATLSLANDQLLKAFSELDGGNLMKAAAENFGKDIQNSIRSIAAGFDGINSAAELTRLTNLAIAGNITEVANELASKVRIPPTLEAELVAKDIKTDFKTPEDISKFIDNSGNLGLSDAALEDVSVLQSTLNNLDNEIVNLDTSVTKTITPGTGSPRNPVVDPSTYSRKSSEAQSSPSAPIAKSSDSQFPFLNSEEEIVRYFQGATREITTVVWHWTAHYTDQGHIGSEHINRSHIARGWNGIGYHFIVKRDGSIQIGRDINTTGAHVGGFNTRSVGISFVAGYKCSSSKYNGIPPSSEVGPESITMAQHEAFKKFMSAWYKVYPGGQAWGHADFPRNSGKVDPGFDVAKRVYEMFGKKNVGHPQRDDRILTAAEIASKTQFA